MRRSLPVLVALALVLVALLAWRTDGFGLLAPHGGTGEVGPADAPDTVAGDPKLAASTAAASDRDPPFVDGEPVGVVDAGLGKASLVGKVTGGGAPLRFARVLVAMAPPHDRVAVRTTKAGTFEVRGLPAGVVDLRVAAEGYRPRSVTSPALADGATTDVGEIALKPLEPQDDGVEVKVVDPSGKPILGAKVTATTVDYGLYISLGPTRAGIPEAVAKDAVTDERGVASITGLPKDRYDVIARAPGFALEAVAGVVLSAGSVVHLKIALEPALSIGGVVVDATGAPVANARVAGMNSATFRSFETVATDADGRFLLDGLVPGHYFVFGFHPDKGEGTAGDSKAGDRNVQVKLQGVGKVTGRVTLAGGAPASSFVLRPYSAQPFRYVYSQLYAFHDPDGRYTLTMPPSTYQVDARAEGGAFVTGPKVTVAPNETATLDIVLPASGVVRGVVTDPDGNHLAGAEVFVNRQGFPPGPVREQYVRTDAEGGFVMTSLPLESVKLHVRHVSFAEVVVDATPTATDSGKPLTVRMEVGARVEGHVTSAKGEPVAGERVNLWRGFDFLGSKTVLTDGNGAYAFTAVPAGTYNLSTGRFEANSQGQSKTGVEVGASGTVVVDFRSTKDETAVGTVAGRVTLGGAPVAGATVTATDERGDDEAVTAKTDADGRYSATGLKPGRIEVEVNVPGGVQSHRTVRVNDATPVSLDVALGSARVVGKIVGSDGNAAVAAAWVSLEMTTGSGGGWSNVKGWGQTDAQGAFSMSGLDPGTYRLRVNGSNYAARVTDPFSVGEGESRDLGLVRLEAGGGIAGRVVDDRGVPVEGIGVSLKNSRGEVVFLLSMSSTGSDGRYAVQSVEVGRYTIRFEGRGYAPYETAVDVTAAGATVDAKLARGGSISVRVEDEAGAPLSGATVELYVGGTRLTKTLTVANLFDADVTHTGEQGTTTIPDLAPGAYTVRMSKEGWTLVSDVVATVSSGTASSVRLVAKKGI